MSTQKLAEYLGQPRYREEAAREQNEIGVVTGLAWTPVGGETLSIEAAVTPGTGAVQLTGHLGDVMQESGRAAMTYVRAHAQEWGSTLLHFSNWTFTCMFRRAPYPRTDQRGRCHGVGGV
jgi:ATP-dependent Lon protease